MIIQIYVFPALRVQVIVSQGIFRRPRNPQLLDRLPDCLEANAVAIPQTFQNEALNKVLEGKEERFAGEHGAQRSHSIGTNYPIADLLVVHVEITCGFFYGVVGDFIRLELRPFHKPFDAPQKYSGNPESGNGSFV